MKFPISNKFNLCLAAAYAPFAFFCGLPAESVKTNLLFAIAVLVVAAILFFKGWMGGGAAKFYAVSALWLGPSSQFALVCLVSIVGASLLALAVKGRGAEAPFGLFAILTFAVLFPTSSSWTYLANGVHRLVA